MLNLAINQNWFQHDIYSLSDTNVQLFICDVGPAGYGIFWAVVEKLYQNGEEGLDAKDIKVLARQVNAPIELMSDAMEKMAENDLVFKAANGRYYSRRVSASLREMKDARIAYIGQKSAAGKASASARKESRKGEKTDNSLEGVVNQHPSTSVEHPSTSVEHQSTHVERTPTGVQRPSTYRTGQTGQTGETGEKRTGQDPQTPLRGDLPSVGSSVVLSQPSETGPSAQSDVVLFPGFKVGKGDLEKLEAEFGRTNVEKAVEKLAGRIGDGLRVKNPPGLMRGLLQRMLNDGEISLPREDKPVPCPTGDGRCPECGDVLHMTSNYGREWTCYKCKRRWRLGKDGSFAREV